MLFLHFKHILFQPVVSLFSVGRDYFFRLFHTWPMVVVLLLGLSPTFVLANGPEKDSIAVKNQKTFHNYLQIGVIGSDFAVRDASTSPLIYQGMEIGAHIGYLMYSERVKYNIDFNLLFGKLTTRNYPEYDQNKAVSINGFMDACVQKRIFLTFESKWRLWCGGDIGTIADIRTNTKYNNANLNYEGFISLGPIVSLERILDMDAHQIDLGIFKYPLRDRKMKFVFSAFVPFVSEAYRPDYSVIDDFVDGARKYVDLHRFKTVTFDKFFTGTAKIEIFYYLQNRNMFKFGYNWNYFDYHGVENPVKGVNGNLSFSIIFRFNK